METLKVMLAELGVGDAAQTVYLSLLRDGQASPRLIAQRTGITRPSVYDQLKVLMAHDLVVELNVSGKAVFAATHLERLDAMLHERIDRLEAGRVRLLAEIPELLAQTKSVEPKIRFFEGKEGVTQLMKDILWHDRITLKVVWPDPEMRTVFGDDFLSWFSERSLVRRNRMELILPKSAARGKAPSPLWTEHSVCRYADGRVLGKMGYVIYADRVAFVSSPAERFGFIVESAEFSALMDAQFTLLWNALRG